MRVVDAPDRQAAALSAAVSAYEAEFLLVLRAGDTLAPGALAALAFAAWLDAADAVAGLRIIHRDGVIAHLDILASPPGFLRDDEARAALRPASVTAPFRGGEILLRGSAVARAGGLSAAAGDPVAELWPRLARSGCRLARIGRPVLVQNEPDAIDNVPPRALRIAALNDSGPNGGAGIAHRRLAEALRYGGHEVVPHALNDESPGVAAEWTDRFPATEAAILAEAPDLILAGNLHGATRTVGMLERLHACAPVAAVLHDLFLLTGRCAHPDPGNRIATGCDALCPTPDLYPQLQPARIASVFRDKRRFLATTPAPLLLANSAWTEERARHLAPEGSRIARIDLAFPTQVFRPGDKRELRRRLGLSETDFLILFGAVIADQPSKGGVDLAASLAQVAAPGIGFVAIGRIDDPAAFPLPNLVLAGPVGDEADLAAWYGACDLHVTASRLETLGQTAIEAGLCGLPTVAYRSTGLTTAVIDGVSGMLVEPEPGALAAAISALIADPGRLANLSRWGRMALESRNSHAASYLTLHDAFVELGLRLPASEDGRIRLGAETLGSFAFASAPHPGAGATVGPASRPFIRLARRLKQRVWGRTQPLWMRRALYAGYRARREAARLLGWSAR
ncbi:glycosyltransferase [uncultured Enterovirga sp.]|uniref:glycosyltransferase n=1 Tax=uncultured Enterovirga sp. TaxID=2026352 RepID=UPI0035CA732D